MKDFDKGSYELLAIIWHAFSYIEDWYIKLPFLYFALVKFIVNKTFNRPIKEA